MPDKFILDFSYEEFCSYIESIGEKSFRSHQIFNWIYQKSILDFSQMKNLSADLRRHLKEEFLFPVVNCLGLSEDDSGTKKFLFELFDGQKIETVLIPAGKRLTVCVSSQAGCKFDCKFCASGIGGWVRNLSCGEILMQILQAQIQAERKITHVVFMGTGEPLDNWDEVKRAIEIINSSEGFNTAARRITVSTCGVLSKMKEMISLGRQIELAVSLHGYKDEVREQLMPINKTYPLKELIKECREYVKKTNRQITFEYVLIDGLTCCEEAPEVLARLLRGLKCKLNLIPYNPVEEFDWKVPSRNMIYRFRDALIEKGVHATIRWSKGGEARGACGQLRRQN